MKPLVQRGLLSSLPLIIAGGAAYLLRSDQRLLIETTLSDTLLFAGGLLTVVAWLLTWVWWRGVRITEKRNAALLEESIVNHRRFLQRLDHELKNPLMAIRAVIDNEQFKRSLASELDPLPVNGDAAALDRVNAQVTRLSQIVTDLRKVSDAETVPIETAPVDLNLLLSDTFVLLQEHPDAAARQLRLTIPQAPWPLPTIAGDWDLLYLAFYNLLENAIKYSSDGDSIEVRAREEKNRVIIEVADTGAGITADDLPHIWEELYRANRTRSVGGSGLGLALTRAVIQRHGGVVAADSRLEQGTVIQVELPVTGAQD
ncbi:MAG: HAMP domain-containing histidine kinase [Caldilineaceae bacterium]|nr:HAMP domain-containing histidine kinase [Caldilineaceae bacterium]MCB9138032.1 HAMP domain-containing histidine kinase [Caldilineaceae bacterium]